MIEEALKACPFCGSAAERLTLGKDDGPGNEGGDVICCTGCGASSHVEFGRKENLVSRWNTRQPSIDVEKVIEVLEFYAEPETWFGFYTVADSPINQDWGDDCVSPQFPDGKPGKLARQVLAALKARSNG